MIEKCSGRGVTFWNYISNIASIQELKIRNLLNYIKF